MCKALPDPVIDDVHQECVRAERRRDEVTDTGMPSGGFGGKRRDVTIPVVPGPEEVRRDHHGCRTRGDTGIEGSADRRLREFHVRCLHDRSIATASPLRDERLVAPVRLLTARTVIDDDDSDRTVLEFHHQFVPGVPLNGPTTSLVIQPP